MKKKLFFFIFLLVMVIILFCVLYVIGIMNYFENDLIKQFKILDFSFLGKWIIILYFIIVSIFMFVVIGIMAGLILSVKDDNSDLTALNIEDFSIKNKGPDGISNSFDKLVSSLNKNLDAIQKYTEVIDSDVDRMDKAKLESIIREKIDVIYQNFSQMINDMIQSSNVTELFEKVLFWGASFTQSDRASLMIVDKSKELYIFKTIGWSDDVKQKTDNIKIPLGTGIAGKVAAENKRVFVTNIENYDAYDFKFRENYRTKSFISMPIFGIKKVVAVLNLTDNKNDIYSINDLEILNVITGLASKIFELVQMKKKII